MIIVKLNGGRANQLFQYAVGRRLSIAKKVPLLLDTSNYSRTDWGTDTPRRYELGDYKIKARIATADEIHSVLNDRANLILRSLLSLFNIRPLRFRAHIKEQNSNYIPSILRARANSFLEGWWQSYKYFQPVWDEIHEEFELISPATGVNAKMLADIQNESSLAIHVRRGDYVSNPNAQTYHGNIGLEYYMQAYKTVKDLAGHIDSVYIFSDEPEWVKKNLAIDGVKVIYATQNDPDHGHEDIRLMAACKHQIIANSSFSWWAAWLNRNPAKVVVAPKYWFKDVLSSDDLIPKEWIRL